MNEEIKQRQLERAAAQKALHDADFALDRAWRNYIRGIVDGLPEVFIVEQLDTRTGLTGKWASTRDKLFTLLDYHREQHEQTPELTPDGKVYTPVFVYTFTPIKQEAVNE